MQAVILAAGRGRRLIPETTNLPKSLIDVGGIPIILRTLNALPDCVDSLHIVVNYLHTMLMDRVGSVQFGRPIEYHVQDNLAGTSAALSCVAPSLRDRGRFMVLCGDDIYSKSDLTTLASRHLARGVVLGKQAAETGTGAYVLDSNYFSYPVLLTNAGEESIPHTVSQIPDLETVLFKDWIQINTHEQLALARKRYPRPSF